MLSNPTKGHLLAIFTILVWGVTFSSTKILLPDFAPAEILFIRFFIAYVFLSLLCVKLHTQCIAFVSFSNEILFILAGLSGGCLYFLAENVALLYTTASNASLLVAINPFFTGLLFAFVYGKKLSRFFILGFFVSFVGIFLVIFQGELSLQIYPIGDLLCILAGIIWSVYTLVLEMIFARFKGISHLVILKRIFFYGLLFTLPFTLYQSGILQGDFHTLQDFTRYTKVSNLANLFFLGLVASGLCYLSWNASLKLLGSLKASAYIYSVPVIGVIAACVSLGEVLSVYIIIGGILTLLGLFLSQRG